MQQPAQGLFPSSGIGSARRIDRIHAVTVLNLKRARMPEAVYAAKRIKNEISGNDATMLAVITMPTRLRNGFFLRAPVP